MWEVIASLGLSGAEVLLGLAAQLATVYVQPPPCPPSDGSFPEETIRYAVSVARSVAWGQPC